MKATKRCDVVIFDLEFTAWEGSLAGGWSRPGEAKEVVQIGAVKLDCGALRIKDTFEILVRPRWNPVLSDYFVALTGISNADVERRGVDFITAMRAFLAFVGSASLWAYGRDDLVLADNLALYGWEREFTIPPYRNVIPWLAAQGLDMTSKHAYDVAAAAGVAAEGRAHDALADARAVALGMCALIGRGAPNPFVAAPLTS